MANGKAGGQRPILKIQWKFSIIIVVIVMIMGSLVLACLAVLHKALHDEHIAKGFVISRNMAVNSVNPILVNNIVALQSLLINAKEIEDEIVYAFVLDPQGEIIAHTFEQGFPAELLQAVHATPQPVDSMQSFETEDGIICDIVIPIIEGEVGFFHVGLSDSLINAKIADVKIRLITLTMLVLLAGLLVAYILSAIITRPITALTRAAESVGRGEFDQRIQISTNDEVGLLAKTFNRMSDDRSRNRQEQKRAATEKEQLIAELQKALVEIKTLQGIIPICASCKKIRDTDGLWNQIESYIRDHSEADFTHGICPDCAKKLYPDYDLDKVK